MLTSTLAQNQTILSLDDVMHLTDPPVEPEAADDAIEPDEEDLLLPDPTYEESEEAAP